MPVVEVPAGPIHGPHAHLQVPEGPWKAPTWAIERPVRFSTSGTEVCAVSGCDRPAGRAEGDVARATDVLCVAHRRRMAKAKARDLADFITSQAGKPIYPARGARTRRPTYPVVDFTLVDPNLAHELRFVTGTKINRRAWRDPKYIAGVLRAAVEYAAGTGVTTLMDFPAAPDGPFGSHRRTEMFPGLVGAHWRDLTSALPSMVKVLRDATPDPWDSNLWRAADLGFGDSEKALPSLSWNAVTCDWLRNGLKSYARQHLLAGTRAWSTLASYVRGGSLLSRFMDDETGPVAPDEVSRSFFLDLVAWVRSEDATRTDLSAVTSLARVLTDLRELDIVPTLPSTVFLLRGENRNRQTRRPKPLPADILERFDHMIATAQDVPSGVRLMLRVYRAVGPRSSECLTLPRDCIRHLHGRGYTLEYHQSKTDSIRAVPMPDKLGEDLAAHALWVAEMLGPDYPWLFPRLDEQPRMHHLVHHAGQPRPWSYQAFSTAVWALYRKHGITSSTITGEVLTGAQLHRFRHTIATGLLNEGWSQYEVQKFLGHESATMMQAYAEIHDDTLQRKYSEFIKHAIDVTGARHQESLDATVTVERLRDRMVRSALPNGYCVLPEKQDCDFAPSPCLSCKPFFRTTPTFLPIHIRQRDESLRQLDLAREQGRERAAEIHARTAERLNVIIDTLEGQEPDIEVGAAG